MLGNGDGEGGKELAPNPYEPVRGEEEGVWGGPSAATALLLGPLPSDRCCWEDIFFCFLFDFLFFLFSNGIV